MNYDNIQPLLGDFLRRGMVISPWLMMHSQARFDVNLFSDIDRLARDMVAVKWTDAEKIEVFGEFPLSERVPRTAAYEIIASTALSIAHDKFGDLEIYPEQILEAINLLNNFSTDYGFGNIVKIYGFVTSFENAQALHYYGQIPEKIFNLGSWHRPWVDYSLNDEILWGVFQGNYQLKIEDHQRYVALTEKGEAFYFATINILEECGYLTQRVRQLQIHNFSFYSNYAEVAENYFPNMIQLRKDLLKWLGIEQGMRVLELGCADGVSTYESGLVDLIGEGGRIDAIDPSMGMIFRANTRKEKNKTNWVTFHQGKAEHLPFADETFDAVIAFASLQFMDLPQAFAEIKRVLKPGRWFTSLHPVRFNLLDHPIFKEWYDPIVKLAQSSRNENPKDVLKFPEETLKVFHQSGFVEIEATPVDLIWFLGDPDIVAHHTFRGIGWMQEELSTIPWQAREDIIAQVVEQGKVMCEKYTDEERMVKFPMQMIKGKKSKSTGY
jgi:ubiquinone/menaquinone biosynthesis C-methylase UbiE